jgi:hypothetical protein
MFPRGRDPVVTFSLTEPFGDARECYKIVATLWPSPEMRGFRWPKVGMRGDRASRPATNRRWQYGEANATPLLRPTTRGR